MAEQGTVISVIGDREQSIYGFAGASPNDFDEFHLPDCISLHIPGNRRSTKRIVNFLNALRSDSLKQNALGDTVGDPVIVLVGPHEKMLDDARQTLLQANAGELVVLLRSNKQVVATRSPGNIVAENLWQEFDRVDSSRAEFVERLLKGTEIANNGDVATGLRTILKALRVRSSGPFKCEKELNDEAKRALAVGMLEFLLSNRAKLLTLSLYELYEEIRDQLAFLNSEVSLQKVRAGAFKEFADSTLLSVLMSSLELPEDHHEVRTMHRVKGLEFPNVYVRLENGRKKADTAELLLSNMLGSTPSNEEGRLVYVACSRPTERLFISLSSLSDDLEHSLSSLGVLVHRSSAVSKQATIQGALDF